MITNLLTLADWIAMLTNKKFTVLCVTVAYKVLESIHRIAHGVVCEE